MEQNNVEEKRNTLNLYIRELLSIVDFIDGNPKEYENYIVNTLSEIEFLDQQLKLVKEAKEKLINVFKDK